MSSAEWQEAADAALFGLTLDSAYQYGLLTGPAVRVNRCLRVLKDAKKMGIEPKPIKDQMKEITE